MLCILITLLVDIIEEVDKLYTNVCTFVKINILKNINVNFTIYAHSSKYIYIKIGKY